jgi:hypothetical protein
VRRFVVKKDGVIIVNKPHLIKIFPLFYQKCFSSQLKKAKYLTLASLIALLQIHKQVSIYRLATAWSYPYYLRVGDAAFKDFLS